MILPLLFAFAGLMLLLAGMKLLRVGLGKFAGSQFQVTLHKLTVTPGRGFLCGIVATGFLQSSTALTVMAVSLVDAGILGFEKTLALILGSNIGATLTPQLLAFPLEKISIWFIFIGSLGYIILKNRTRFLFLSLAGTGTMFLALALLETTMAPMVSMPWVQNWLHHLGNNYAWCIYAGTIISALLHSSSATTALAMLLTEEGWLTLPASLAFILGANIGTCFTALIVSFFASRSAQKVAVFHVLLNIFGVLVFYPLLIPIANMIVVLGDIPGRQVANAHTFFNIASSLVILPFLPQATSLLNRLR